MAYFYCAAYTQAMVCKTSPPCGQRCITKVIGYKPN